MPKPEVVLGIDPGTAAMGIGLVEKVGHKLRLLKYDCLRTKAGVLPAQRLNVLYKALKRVIAKHRPDTIAIENLFFSRNVKTAMSVAQSFLLAAVEQTTMAGLAQLSIFRMVYQPSWT